MMEYLPLVYSLILPLLAGCSLLLIIFNNAQLPLLCKLSLGYLIGLGLLSFWMFILSLLSIDYSMVTTSLPLILFSIICILRSLTFKTHQHHLLKRPDGPEWAAPFSTLILFCKFLIISSILILIYQNLLMPVFSWDAFSTIAFKAKIIFYSKTIPDLKLLPHSPYPLLVNLIEAWTALCLNGWREEWVTFCFPYIGISFLFAFYYLLKNLCNSSWAILGCTLLIGSNLFMTHMGISYMDFTVMAYHCLALLLIINWDKTNENRLLLCAGFMGGFATFTKLEGTAYLLIELILLAFLLCFKNKIHIKDKFRQFSLFGAPSITLCLSFHVYKFLIQATQESGITDKTQILLTFDQFHKIPELSAALSEQLLFENNWNLVWLIAFLSLFPAKKTFTKETLSVLVTIFIHFGLIMALGLFTSNEYWILGEGRYNVLGRLLLHFYPLAPLFIILRNYSIFERRVE